MAANLYHSKLKEMGAVQVVVKSGRQVSKFSKPGALKPDYVNLAIGGVDYSYSSENEACAAFWAPYVGKTITIQADGKAETGTIQYLGQPGSQVAPPTAQHQPPAQTQQPPPPQEQRRGPQPHTATAPATGAAAAPAEKRDVGKAFEHFVARNRAMAIVGLRAAVSLKYEYETATNMEMPDPLLVAIYNSMMFGSSNAGFLASNHEMPINAVFPPMPHPMAQR